MSCVNPVTIRRERLGIPSLEFVPCGKCPGCVKDKQNSFVIRSVEEQHKRGSMWFVTLTYANDNVPVAFDSDGEIIDVDLVPIAKDPVKFRNRDISFGFRNNSDIDKNIEFDVVKYDNDSVDIPLDIYCPFSDNEIVNRDMPMDVYLGVERSCFLDKRVDDDMPLDVYNGIGDNHWRGAKSCISDISVENSFDISDVVDENGELPRNIYSLNNDDIAKWKKRCRRYIEYHFHKKLDFGYMICGEYGPRTHRPHYHGLLVGLSDEEVEVFRRDWTKHYGYVCFKKISVSDVERTAKYVAKYITKMKCLEDPNVVKGLVQKPRKVVSRGYGLPTIERRCMLLSDIVGSTNLDIVENCDNVDDISVVRLNNCVKRISKNLKYKLNGKEYKLPRYYREKFFYVKDALTGRYRPSALSNLVSRALLDNVRKDFIGKCIELASHYENPESYETYRLVAKRVCAIEQGRREVLASSIVENNKSAMRKSRF